MRRFTLLAATIALPFFSMCFLSLAVAAAAARDVQIVDVDFTTQVIELFNFGTETEDLSGWRFCSQNSTFVRQYTSSTALNGIAIESGQALFVHLSSDAGGQPGHIDRPAGFWADPMDPTAHGLGIYFAPVLFISGDTMADHVQWSIDGTDNPIADERSDEAEAGGVWSDQSTWVVTQSDSTSINLIEAANGLILHGPSDYIQVPEPELISLSTSALAALLILAFRRRKTQA